MSHSRTRGRLPLAPMLVAATTVLGCYAADGVTAPHDAAIRFAYTGMEWEPPVNLGPLINGASSEGQLGIAPNGQSLYVSSNRAGTLGNQDIWVSSRRPDGTWGPMVNLGPTVNSSEIDVSPTLTIDGQYLYFASRRAGGEGGLDCWRTHRVDVNDDFSWETPVNLGPVVNSALDEADCLPVGPQNAGGEFWFTSLFRPAGQGGYDIYRSEIAPDGSFSAPTPVFELNTIGRDTRMTITGNGLTVYFTSNRAGGVGAIDIWTASRRTKNSPFCTPVNLGPIVNSSDNDNSPSISTNGQELYFTSARAGGFGDQDVYVARHVGGQAPDNC